MLPSADGQGVWDVSTAACTTKPIIKGLLLRLAWKSCTGAEELAGWAYSREKREGIGDVQHVRLKERASLADSEMNLHLQRFDCCVSRRRVSSR